MSGNKSSGFVLSYLTIRKIIGILGILIPFLMGVGGAVFGGVDLLDTISNYYYTNMQDMFGGSLCAVALFLITYKGHPAGGRIKINIDNVVTNIAGAAALGVVLFPMSLKSIIPMHIGTFRLIESVSDALHVASAAVFFLAIAFICMFLFTKTDKKKIGKDKRNRNRVYRSCGIAIVASLALILVYNLFLTGTVLSQLRPLFFLESVALIAFGFAWLVKGETLLKDKPAR